MGGEVITVEPISHHAATSIYRRCWDHVSEDGLDRDEWEADASPRSLHLGALDDGMLVGVVTYELATSACMDSHAAFLPCAYGETAHEAGEQAIAYIWRNTKTETIMARTPAFNRVTVLYLRKLGFVQTGVIPRCWLKNGEYADMIISALVRGV